jgi:hypothetical protein
VNGWPGKSTDWEESSEYQERKDALRRERQPSRGFVCEAFPACSRPAVAKLEHDYGSTWVCAEHDVRRGEVRRDGIDGESF